MGFIATPSTGNVVVWADLAASARMAKIGWLADLGYIFWMAGCCISVAVGCSGFSLFS